jgi:hypothetical protein
VILADTSVWVDHLRKGDQRLAKLLDAAEVLIHPFIVGELALGVMRQRDLILETLHNLPSAMVASPAEALHFIEANALAGSGIGYVDAHLLAATKLTAGARLWTRDKPLFAVAERLGLGARFTQS